MSGHCDPAVSYTHLDVYKRQVIRGVGRGALAVRQATSESRGGGLTQQVFALQARLATILNGMHHTYATTIGADHDGAQHIAGATK